ncbi:MFS transporter [Deinococcus sonorensis]|uniref:MFS transporter n=2 Tax=Deinococcus sonorensis TaxID=309891 RepID=A0AAU7UAL7_9DEIO
MTPSRAAPGLALLFLAQALATGATTASTVLASLVMSSLGRESLAGLPSTLVTLSAALSAGLFGRLMVRGRKPGLIAAYLLGVLGALLGFLGGWHHVVPLFLLGAALVGAAQGGYQQARYAVAEHVPARVRGTVMGAMMLASVLGSVATTALSGLLTTLAARLYTSSEVIGWLLGGAFLLGGALLTAAWRPVRVVADPARPASAAPQLRLWDREVRWPALSVVTAQGLMVTLMSLTPLRAHHMGMDHLQVAGLVTLHITGMFGFSWLSGPLLDRLGQRFGYVAGALLLLAAALSALLGGAWLGPSMFVLGLGWSLCFVAGSTALTPYRSVQGQVDALGYLASAAGTLLGGWLLAQTGFAPLAWTCAALSLLPLLSAFRARPAVQSAPVAAD